MVITMDESVIFIEEVPIIPNVIEDISSPEIKIVQQDFIPLSMEPTIMHKTRPKRNKKPIRTLYEEQQDEKEQLRQNLLKKRKSKVDIIAKMIPDNTLHQKVRGIKRKTEMVEGKTKSCKVEIGGAGSIKRAKIDDDIQIVFEWDAASVISERQGIEEWQARSVIGMFDKENTLPFIARYRKEKTGNLEVEKLREIQNAYAQLKAVKEKVAKVMNNGENLRKLAVDQKKCLLRATTSQEVEHLIAPLKTAKKQTYAERARKLGLNDIAIQFLNTSPNQIMNREQLFCYINQSKEGLSSIEEVEQGIQHIIAEIISKDIVVLDYVRDLMKNCSPMLECHRKKQVRRKDARKTVAPDESICSKYEFYFNYKSYVNAVKPHQILAINRGEKQNVLSVKIVMYEASVPFLNFCQRNYVVAEEQYYRFQMMCSSIEDSWERLVKPFMQRQIRSQLTEMAEIASVEVFTSNLKRLLLTPPIRGKTILAIDPGFTHGCKIAVTNFKGELLLTTTIYPFRKNSQQTPVDWNKDHNARTLREIVLKHSCELFAVGNGTACREMEEYLTFLINSGCFAPFNVQYTIINESGVSQYSITPEARADFPGMDPNHISAVSLARRLQDPLLEYVKVHPMHLGVGMYQHDIPEKLLHSSLDSVMIECVSFVGVDINVASELVLRKLSGLNKTRAANIVDYRKKNGPIINREQLRSVRGIGPVTYEQCAGFVRILPETLDIPSDENMKTRKIIAVSSLCPLDRTLIHPESYNVANRLMKLVNVQTADIGTNDFIRKIIEFSKKSSLDELSAQFKSTVPTIQLILEGLSLPIDFDMRAQFDKPLFRKGVMSMHDLTIGLKVTGNVQNVTHFGAFVDIGVGTCGLIHSTKMRGLRIELGSIVEVSVNNIDIERGRIGLVLDRVLN